MPGLFHPCTFLFFKFMFNSLCHPGFRTAGNASRQPGQNVFAFSIFLILNPFLGSSLLYIFSQDCADISESKGAESSAAESPPAFYVHSPWLDSSPVATSPSDNDSGWRMSSPEVIVSSPE